jgi:hypothetical protein
MGSRGELTGRVCWGLPRHRYAALAEGRCAPADHDTREDIRNKVAGSRLPHFQGDFFLHRYQEIGAPPARWRSFKKSKSMAWPRLAAATRTGLDHHEWRRKVEVFGQAGLEAHVQRESPEYRRIGDENRRHIRTTQTFPWSNRIQGGF